MFRNVAEFHEWLAESLCNRRAEIERGFGHRLPTAAELDTMALLGRLSDDAANVSEHLFLLFEMMLLIESAEPRFERVSNALFGTIGTDVLPRDAADLVRRLITQALGGEPRQRVDGDLSAHHHRLDDLQTMLVPRRRKPRLQIG